MRAHLPIDEVWNFIFQKVGEAGFGGGAGGGAPHAIDVRSRL
jgi:hypothetical protein